jgi:tetratricopeptide (TPR) repeat protein
MQGFRLENDMLSFINNLKDLQNMIELLVEKGNLEEVSKINANSIDLFFQIMNKDSANTETPPIVISSLNIMEKRKDLLQVVDAIDFLEVLPLMYEALRKEIFIHVLFALENISARHFPDIDFYPIVFSLMCTLDLHQLALEELDSQVSKDDTYWNNKAALKSKMGLYKEALLCYDLAISVRTHPLYYANKARIYESLNRLPECLELLRKATKLVQEEWFEINQYDPLEAKTIIYMIYQNKLGALYEYYHVVKNQNNSNLEQLKIELLDCVDKLSVYSIGEDQLKITLDKIKKEIENNEVNNELLLRPRDRTTIQCGECGKKDIYNAIQTPSFSSCGNCRSVVYCSRECQKKNWPDHKEFCKRAEFILTHQQEKKQLKNKNNNNKGNDETTDDSLNSKVIPQKQNKNE